jgi:sodium pump decarboxylase gamma subunit
VTWLNSWWNQVSGTVLHGFEITVVGMSLVFFTLGLVILAMILLTKLPWLQPKDAPEEKAVPPTAPEPVAAAPQPASQEGELARVAAIAVAMLHSQRSVRRHPQTKSTRSAWKSYGRAHQLGL